MEIDDVDVRYRRQPSNMGGLLAPNVGLSTRNNNNNNLPIIMLRRYISRRNIIIVVMVIILYEVYQISVVVEQDLVSSINDEQKKFIDVNEDMVSINEIEVVDGVNNTVMNTSLPSQLLSSTSLSKLPTSVPTSKPSNSPIEFVEGTVEKIIRDHPHRGATDEYGRYGYIANVTLLRQWMLHKYCTIETNNNNNNNNNNTTMLSCKMPFINQREMDNVCNTPITGHELQYRGQYGWNIIKNIIHIRAIVTRIGHGYWYEGRYGWNIMKNIIHIPSEDSMLLIDPIAPKILCSIYTYEQREDHIRGISETWGWRCDGFFAASTKTTTKFNMTKYSNNNNDVIYKNYESPPIEMINLLHEGEEIYDNMWQKTRSILSYMYDHYLNEYDYFYVCGDDTHLIVENLKRFLLDYSNNNNNNENNTSRYIRNHLGTILLEPDDTFFTGQILKEARNEWIGNQYFASGGGGYVISRLALKRLVEDALPHCFEHLTSPVEDRATSYCLLDFLNITFLDAADMNGKQRFHNFIPNNIATGQSEVGWYNFTSEHWRTVHGNITHSDLISPSSIAFHHLKSIEAMKRHHVMLYYNYNHGHYNHLNNNNPDETGACPIDSVLFQALSS